MSDDDDIIDLTRYLEGSQTGDDDAFAVYGGGGPGSRFALPVWRSVYLLGGDRGAVVLAPRGAAEPAPVFVLDLKVDPARQEFSLPLDELASASGGEAPCIAYREGADWVAAYLGEKEEGLFYMVVTGLDDFGPIEESRVRQDFMFLAGECAGLVLHWEIEKLEGPPI